jgi:GH15 family glucan-1,4-alpha-glucosidase
MMQERHTYEMGVIGNCAYLALVDRGARVVWLCFPHFDSSFVFGRLLDPDRGGEFSIGGYGETKASRQYYVTNTNVLVTELETAEGTIRVTDCAPRFAHYGRFFRPLMLVRKIEPLRGNPRVRVFCRPRGDYGAFEPEAQKASNHLRYQYGSGVLRLTTNVSLSYITDEKLFVLDEPKHLILTWGIPIEDTIERTAEDYIGQTIAYWRTWVRHCSIGRFYQKDVVRSALVLKVHQFEDTGAIVAASTTSLPEAPGSGRNWDYRYCWIRDTFYTLNALSRISQFEEMQAFANFIENIAAEAATRDHYPPVVRINGDFIIPERMLELKGYDGHNQVRVGNQAHSHIQNDVYGQMILAILQLYIDERFQHQLKSTAKRIIMILLERIARTIDEPDATLWEFRTSAHRHVYTSLFHWVGAKAATKIGRHLGDADILRLGTKLVGKSARNVEECYNRDLHAYAQSPGSANMDASSLHLITTHFLDPTSERAKLHLHEIERQLKTPEGLIFRYRHADDFGKPETTFLVCAFWYVESLAAMGAIEEALRLLDRLLGYSNHLGLFSEDVEARSGSQWGNFPQMYSHVGLMNAVFRIASRVDYPEFF